MDTTFIIWTASVVLIVLGFAGLFLPVLPGSVLLFAGFLLGAWADDFAYVGAPTLVILGVLAVLTNVVDVAAGVFGAKRFGASKQSMTGALIGTLIGIFFGVPGIVLGPFLGAAAGEFLVQRNLPAMARAGIGATLGLVLGVATKLALAFLMVVFFLAVRLA